MDTNRLRECLQLLDMSQPRLADICCMDERRVRRMASGKAEIPETVAAVLEILVSVMDKPSEQSITLVLNSMMKVWARRAPEKLVAASE